MPLTFIPKPTRARPYLLGRRRVSLSEAADTLGVGLATVLRHTTSGRINVAAIKALVPGEPLRRPARKSKSGREARFAECPRYEHDGRNLTLAEWAGITGIDRRRLYHRIETCGWEIERALTQPVVQQCRSIPVRNVKIISRIVAAFHEARA